MKKWMLPLLLFLNAQVLVAQDLEEVKKYFNLISLGRSKNEAKESVDKYLAVDKNARKPDGWFYKGYIYNSLSKDSSLALEQSATFKREAFAALKKYREMDPKADVVAQYSNPPEKKFELLNSVFYEIYAGFAQDLGITAYNKKELVQAAGFFEDAIGIQEYMSSNNMSLSGGYRLPAVDTTLNLYAGIAYNQANMQDKGMPYYQKLSDAGIGGEQYLDVYQQLADYYRGKKDDAAFNAAIAKGRGLYPKNDDYWVALEIEYAVDGVEKPAVFERYESLLSKYPDHFAINYNYAVELFQYVNSEERKTANNEAYKTKITGLIDKAIRANPNSSEANFLKANFTYNNSIDISEAAQKIKGPKPEDLKRKKEMNDRSLKMMDEAIPYAEKVVELFGGIAKPKSSEKINYRQSLVILRNIYEMKKDTARADKYDKMIKAFQ